MISDLHAMLATITQASDAARLNEIINDPAILPFVKGRLTPPLDFTDAVRDPSNVVLLGEHGAIIFHQPQPGAWEAHTNILPAGRGAWAVLFVRACLMWMFCRTDALDLTTRCPRGNYAAKALTKAIGGEYEFHLRNGWIMNGESIPADIFSLSIQRWMRDAPGLEERGKWFEEKFAAGCRTFGHEPPLSLGDPAAQRYRGALYEMLTGGTIDKGLIFFHRYAALADEPPITVRSYTPLSLDIAGVTIIVRKNSDFFVAAVLDDNQTEAAGG